MTSRPDDHLGEAWRATTSLGSGNGRTRHRRPCGVHADLREGPGGKPVVTGVDRSDRAHARGTYSTLLHGQDELPGSNRPSASSARGGPMRWPASRRSPGPVARTAGHTRLLRSVAAVQDPPPGPSTRRAARRKKGRFTGRRTRHARLASPCLRTQWRQHQARPRRLAAGRNLTGRTRGGSRSPRRQLDRHGRTATRHDPRPVEPSAEAPLAENTRRRSAHWTRRSASISSPTQV